MTEQENKLIFIIEDDKDSAQFLQWTLEDEGYEVATEGHGHEALNRISDRSQKAPSLIILDMNLHDLHGTDFLTQLALMPKIDIPIIVMTGENHAEQYLTLQGVVDLMKKPFNLVYLTDKVQNIP